MPYRLDIPGWMSIFDFYTIELLSATVPENGVVVEVGSAWGRSAWAWAKSVKPSVKVYCIDPWFSKDPSKEQFLENVKDCPNIIPIHDYSPTMKWDKAIRPDVVFIDGNHQSPHVDNDLAFWSKQIKPTGILSGHDFTPSHFPDVCRAVIQLAIKLNKPFRLVDNSSIWYFEMGKEKITGHNERLIARLMLDEQSYDPYESLRNLPFNLKEKTLK